MQDIKQPLLEEDERTYQYDFEQQAAARRKTKKRRFLNFILSGALLGGIAYQTYRHCCHGTKSTQLPHLDHKLSLEELEAICPTYEAVLPPSASNLDDQFNKIVSDNHFKDEAAKLLSGIVQVNSESFDDSGPVGQDSRWDRFANLHAYLEKSYPLIHKHLTKQTANTYGLLYTWEGKNTDLKPIVLMAHQDTVPVEMNTLDQWDYPPWSGKIDDKFVHGRGSSDDKSSLTAVMIAVERLLKNGFQPERTILLSFGFDEESKGFNGANHLAQLIENIYGPDSVEMIIDEGGSMLNYKNKQMGLVGTSEKGYLDVNITLETPGGHSSAPPGPTNVEILTDILTELKQINYVPHLTPRNPHYFGFLRCAAVHAPDFPKELRDAILSLESGQNYNDPKVKALAEQLAEFGGEQERYRLQTSQATTIMRSGVKANELPEFGFVLLNHRIAVEEDSDFVRTLTGNVLSQKAKEYNLGLKLWGEETDIEGKLGYLEARSFGNLDPAINSPTFGDKHFDLIAGTIQHVWEGTSHDGDVVVAPTINTGNTDTRFYWNLTKNIYRYSNSYGEESLNIHTVNEMYGINSLLSNVGFYYEFIRSSDSL